MFAARLPCAAATGTRFAAAQSRASLWVILALALGLRLWNVLSNTYVIFPDETFQYLEQAHRLAFGSGVMTWEFLEGIRSWLLPALLAGVMALADAAGCGPQTYVGVVRALCALLSLAVPWLGYWCGRSQGGWAGAVTTGTICALWYDLIYFSPVVLTETVAAHCAMLAYAVGQDWANGERDRPRGWLWCAAALYGLAASLRYQYAPGVVVMAAVQFRTQRRAWLTLAAGGAAVILLVLGGLDWASWGTPFQSVWLNFRRNAVDGVSAMMGTEPWSYPFAFFLADWGIAAPVLVGLAVLGARRAPGLAAAAALTLALHALTPHKEVRFLYLPIALAPVLIGLGADRMIQGLRRRQPLVAPAVALVLAGAEAFCAVRGATAPDTWHRDRAAIQAFGAARDLPGLCGVAATLYFPKTGGYTYLHRDVPIYFDRPALLLPGLPTGLPIRVRLNGSDVVQHPGPELLGRPDLFNVVVGRQDDAPPGYARQACFGSGEEHDPTVCVFQRPGACG